MTENRQRRMLTRWTRPKTIIFGHIHLFMLAVVAIFVVFLIFGHIQPDMFVVVAIFIFNFGQVHQVNFRCCQFSFIFTDFGHIHSVMLTTLIFLRTFYWSPQSIRRSATNFVCLSSTCLSVGFCTVCAHFMHLAPPVLYVSLSAKSWHRRDLAPSTHPPQ